MAIFVVALPLGLLSAILYIGLPLMRGQALPGAVPILRAITPTFPWVMIEIFFLAAIVSLIKFYKVGEVSLGIGFWAVGGMMFCIAAISQGLDRVELWDRLEFAQTKKGAAA